MMALCHLKRWGGRSPSTTAGQKAKQKNRSFNTNVLNTKIIHEDIFCQLFSVLGKNLV